MRNTQSNEPKAKLEEGTMIKMSNEEYQLLHRIVPAGVKQAIANGEYMKIASAVTGLKNFEFSDLSRYIGEKMAMRHNKWRGISNGLLALDTLAKDV